MFCKKIRRGMAVFLAFCLMLTAIQVMPEQAMAAGTDNLELSATATASDSETNTSFTPDKLNDGSEDTKWATNPANVTRTVTLAWEAEQTMSAFSILWERRTVQRLTIEVSLTGADDSWSQIYERTEIPAAREERITLANAVTAKFIRFAMSDILGDCVDDSSPMGWPNVAIYELEVYAGDVPDTRSEAQKIVDAIQAPTPGADDASIPMSSVPEGGSIRFCADYEQVIDENGIIYKPLETKVVKGFYEVTCPESDAEPDGSVAQTDEFTITVPGRYTTSQDQNQKPAVIPELQEWHGGTGNFLADSNGWIVVQNSELFDVAKMFAEDYKEMTGLSLSVMDGSAPGVMASAGDFVLSFASESAGLGEEGYTLDIGDTVTINAEHVTGAYWATRTILQVLKQTNGTMPKGFVRDYPKYEVRGFSFDVGRKPFSIDALYEFMENMAWYKMNNLQIHISDNLIFLEDYPDEQTAIKEAYAGFRLESTVKGSVTGKSATSEDVYYTKDQFRQFIKDSRTRGVQIIPEFDMPAHALPFTRAFTEIMSTNTIQGQGRYRIDELDLTKMDQTMGIVKSIWNEYFEGPDPVFDEDTIIHIGTDEYHGVAGQQGIEYFRQFSDKMIEFVQGTGRTVRMWGSLSNKNGTTPVRSENVQLNIWNTGYANPKNMYDMGFDLINTLEGPNYIVPAAGYYNDYINANNIYTNWQPNNFNNFVVRAGDDQMLGGCYAIWHDSVDTRANGISQYDSFDRFFQALPSYGAKLWGDAADRNYKEFSQIFAETSTAPGTTIYGEPDTVSSKVADYKFDGDLNQDASPNGYDLTKVQNAEQVDSSEGKALKLKGGESYVETPLDQVGSNAILKMRVKMDADASGEQILCESKDNFGTYGTYAFKAVQKGTGKVGFSREGYHYSFHYELPKDQWVELEFRSGKDSVELYVDGQLIDNKHYNEDGTLKTTNRGDQVVVISTNNNPDIYFENHPDTELSEKLAKEGITKIATMLVPFGRIGSTTNSFQGEIDYVTVTTEKEVSGEYGRLSREEWTTDACSTHPSEGSQAGTIDGDNSTYWHQNYNSDTSVGTVTDIHPEGAHWFEITLPTPETVAKLTYLPRQDHLNGRIYEYSIVVTDEQGATKTVVDHERWANNTELKTAVFEPVVAKKVKLLMHNTQASHATIAELNLYSEVKVDDVKKKLQDLLADCENYKETDYTTFTWKKLENAKKIAQQVLQSESEIEEDYISAYEQLKTAVERLVPVSGTVPDETVAARKRLVVTVNEMKEFLAEINEDDYTSESIQGLKEIIKDAEKELANANATADSLNGFVDQLNDFELVSKEDVAITAKKKELLDEIKNAEEKELKDTRYTEESLKVLEDAVNQAKQLVEGEATLEDLQEAIDAIEEAKSNLKLKPETPKKYKVTFDSKGGSSVAAKTVTEGQKVKTPANPTRKGYTFGGWYTNSSCTKKYNFSSPVKKNLKLYAKWTKINPFKDGVKMTDKKAKITYRVISAKKKTVMVYKGENKKAKSVTIPSTVTIHKVKCKVVTIGKDAFKGYSKMAKAELGTNVTTIEKNAFSGCKKLNTITLKGKNLKTVQSNAFKGTTKNLTFKTKGMKKSQKDKLLKILKKGGNKKIKVK